MVLAPKAQLINTFCKICDRAKGCNKCDGSDFCHAVSKYPPSMWTEEDITRFLEGAEKKTTSQLIPVAGNLVEDDEEV